MAGELKQLVAYVRQQSGRDPALEEAVVGFYLAFREELMADIRAEDTPAIFAAICRCLDLPLYPQFTQPS